MDQTTGKEQRLRCQIDELQKQWDLLDKQLSRLDRDKILETHADEKFRLEQKIADLKTERQDLERQLSNLETQLSEEKSVARSPTFKKPQPGSIVYKMCNREDQENDFLRFFIPKLRDCPKQPQFYFIHGNDGECHESFIERLEKTRIKKYVEQECGAHYADVYSKMVPWPARGNLEARKEDLIWNFRKTFDRLETTADELANALSRLLSLHKHPMVMIIHNIYMSQWDKRNEQLILWYISECWANLKCHDDTPQFLIFLNIIYSKTGQLRLKQRLLPWAHCSKKYIARQLYSIHTSSGDPDPCQLVEELRAITREDIHQWFSQYGIYKDESERDKKLNAIFQRNGQTVDCKSMAEVEDQLKTIVDEYVQARNNML